MFENCRAIYVAVGLILILLPGVLAAQETAEAQQNDTFILDTSSGSPFRVKLTMVQGLSQTNPGSQGGLGNVYMLLRGNGLSACSVGAPNTRPSTADFANFPAPTTIHPLGEVLCRLAGGQTVVVSGCVARTSFHGFVHADHRSGVDYAGSATIDLVLHKTADRVTAEIDIHTPKGANQTVRPTVRVVSEPDSTSAGDDQHLPNIVL